MRMDVNGGDHEEHFHHLLFMKKKSGIDRNSSTVEADGSRLFHIHLVGPFSSPAGDEICVLLPLAVTGLF